VSIREAGGRAIDRVRIVIKKAKAAGIEEA